MSKPKCYSLNGEDFNFESIEEAINEALDTDFTLHVGSTLTISEGDLISHKAGEFISGYLLDDLANGAWDECGEYAEGWPDCDRSQELDLEQRVRDAVNEWADENGLHPKFYSVGTVKELKVELLSEDGAYRVVEPEVE